MTIVKTFRQDRLFITGFTKLSEDPTSGPSGEDIIQVDIYLYYDY